MSDSSLASFLGEVARPGLVSLPGLRHGLPGLASSFLRPSIVPPVVSVFTLRVAWNWIRSIPSTAGSPGEPVCRGVDLLPPGWDGRFPGGGVFSGMLLGRLRRPGVPPRLACA